MRASVLDVADCGEIVHVRFATDRETGELRGFGHVEFTTLEASKKAIEMTGTDVCGRPIRVDYAAPRAEGGGGGRGGFGGVCTSLCMPLRWRAALSTLQLVQVTGVAVVVEAVASVVAVAVVVVASVCNLLSCAYRLAFAFMRGVAFAGDRGGRGGGFGGGRGGGFGGRGGGRGGFGKLVACSF
jgi:hypothetical protein